jgi:hypothetical protein
LRPRTSIKASDERIDDEKGSDDDEGSDDEVVEIRLEQS